MHNSTEKRHFSRETDNENIVWLCLDKADAGTNVLNPEIFAELDEQLQAIAAEHPQGLVILSGKTNGFIAGADIMSFTRVRTERQAHELLNTGQ